MIISISAVANPLINYDLKIQRTSPYIIINKINGIYEINPILCQNPSPSVENWKIEEIEYFGDSDLPKSLRIRNSKGFGELLILDSFEKANFSYEDISWINKFLSPNQYIFIIGYRCGASGHELIPRDIYDLKYVLKSAR
jgi:hypothetical protein